MLKSLKKKSNNWRTFWISYIYAESLCVPVARIVKMKYLDLDKQPNKAQGNKNKNFCENENSLASKLPPTPY